MFSLPRFFVWVYIFQLPGVSCCKAYNLRCLRVLSTSDLPGDDVLPKRHRYINGTVDKTDGPEKSKRLGDPLESPWIHASGHGKNENHTYKNYI